MRLKNVLLVVSDMEKSVAFYRELFGLQVIRDFGENVMLTEGLVLQEKKSWESAVGQEVFLRSHTCELFFEEYNLDTLVEKLEKSPFPVDFQMPLKQGTDGRRRIRIYDPDRHLIEVAEAVKAGRERRK